MDEPLPGPLNMARDHALALTLPPGSGALRLYRWIRPTVSFGRNEPARGMYDRDRARALGIGFVRRPTGGRAVLHHAELTYALALPLRWLGGLRETHRLVGRGLMRALRGLGVPAELSAGQPGGTRPPGLDEGPCFALPAAGEIVVAGRKLVGSAQARLGGALLQHGSLLVGPGQDLLDGLRGGGRPGAHGSVSLAEVMGDVPDWGELARAVADGLGAELGGRWRRAREGPPPAAEMESSLLERYASGAWTWRR